MGCSSHLLILIIIPLIVFLIYFRGRRENGGSKPKNNLPPSPRKLPLIGNFYQLGGLPHRSLRSLSQRYGQLMLLHFGQVPVLLASSADASREIMKNQELTFSDRPKSSVAEKLFYGSKDVAFAPYGEYWRQMRRICVLQLLGSKKVQSFRRIRDEETTNMVEEIRHLASFSPSLNLSDQLVSLTNNVICRAALGRKYGCEGDFKKLFEEFVALLGTFFIGDYFPWLSWIDRLSGLKGRTEKMARQLDSFLNGVVKEHRDQKTERKKETGEGVNFVDILLDFQHENKDSSPVEDDALKALILDMFAAGTDTTFAALEWEMFELLRHPTSLKKLQTEVRDMVRTKKEITEDDLDEMQYLNAVIKESLRLHPPIPLLVPRECTKDTKVLGYDVAAGTQIIVNAWAIGHDPSLWENPEEFYPERFLESSNINIDYKGFHFELIPFGAGRRGCPGIAFAMAVVRLALVKLVHNFDFTLPDSVMEGNLDMDEKAGLTVHKKLPLIVSVSNDICD